MDEEKNRTDTELQQTASGEEAEDNKTTPSTDDTKPKEESEADGDEVDQESKDTTAAAEDVEDKRTEEADKTDDNKTEDKAGKLNRQYRSKTFKITVERFYYMCHFVRL